MKQIKRKFLKLIALWVNKFHVVPSLNSSVNTQVMLNVKEL